MRSTSTKGPRRNTAARTSPRTSSSSRDAELREALLGKIKKYKRGKLSQAEREALEAIPGWSWDAPSGWEERAVKRLRDIIAEYKSPGNLPTTYMNSATRFINIMSAARYEHGADEKRYLVKWYPSLDTVAAEYPGWETIFHSYRNNRDSGLEMLRMIADKLNKLQQLTAPEMRWLEKRTRVHRRGKLKKFWLNQAKKSPTPNLFVTGYVMAKVIADFKKMVSRWNSDRAWLSKNKNDKLVQKLAASIGIELDKVTDLAPIKTPSLPRGKPAQTFAGLGVAKTTPKISHHLSIYVRTQLAQLAEVVKEFEGKPPEPRTPAHNWLKSLRRKYVAGQLNPAVSDEIRRIGWGELLKAASPLSAAAPDRQEEESERRCDKCKKVKPITSFITHYVLDDGTRKRRKRCRACMRADGSASK